MDRTATARVAAAVCASTIGAAVLVVWLTATAYAAPAFSPWGAPTNAEAVPGTSSELNTPFLDGCPIQSPNGLRLYLASDRPGGLGGIDIWVATRPSTQAPWGAPENLGAPVNSSADDFCPTPIHGKRLFFVSARAGGCGGPDIYLTRRNPAHGWEDPENLGCQVNSPAGEAGPSYVGGVLYFSSARPGGFAAELPGATPDSDIYMTQVEADWTFGPVDIVPSLNTASDDARPNVRKDGLEVVFDSNRPGTLGGPDIWSSTRRSTDDAWSTPVNLETVNTASNETRASLSWDGTTLTFGSNRSGGEGSTDVYVAAREKLKSDGSQG